MLRQRFLALPVLEGSRIFLVNVENITTVEPEGDNQVRIFTNDRLSTLVPISISDFMGRVTDPVQDETR